MARMARLFLAAAIGALVAATNPVIAQWVVDGEAISDSGTVAAAKAEGRLFIYGTYPTEAMNPIIAAFQADTGLKVEYLRLPTQPLYQRVVAEFAAKKLEADYIDLTDLPLIQQFADRGILNAPRKVPAFHRIAAEVRDPDGKWYALMRPISLIGVNTARAPELPATWSDVLKPHWKGLLGISTIDGGGPFILNTFWREKIDPDFWRKLAAQAPRIYPAAGPLMTDLARGEIAIGMAALGELVVSQAKAGAPLKAVFPREGVPGFPVAGGVSSAAKNPNAAALWLDWMTSRRGGNVIAAGGAYPTNPDASAPRLGDIGYPPASQVWNIRLSDWLATRDSYIREWRATFGLK